MKLTIISGRSGAGKTAALHAFEDFGFYAIDNLPLTLLPHLVETLRPHCKRLAVGVDVRNQPDDIKQFPAIVDQLRANKEQVEVLFFDAEDRILLKRFSETRRRHPLSRDGMALPDALAYERKALDDIAARADLFVDTTQLSLHQLRTLVRERWLSDDIHGLALRFESFGFKYGTPQDADFIFDVRCLPNPYWDPTLREFSGLDEPVIRFLEQEDEVRKMCKDIGDFVTTWLPGFEKNNRSYLTVCIGCTGGHHRSVYIASELATRFRSQHKNVQVRHRELNH